MALNRIRRRAGRDRRGMAMVEMIFVLPLLLLLIFAIAEVGLMFQRWLTLSNAVREGARELVVFRSPAACNAGQVETDVKNRVVAYANAGGVGIDAGDVTVTGMCAGSGTAGNVSATFPFQLNIPFASSLGTIDLEYEAEMRNE